MSVDQPPPRSGLKQLVGFVVSGSLAFVVDVAVTKLVQTFAGLPWGISRIIAIGFAMVVAWLSHRTFTFAVQARPTLTEFIKYAGVGASGAALNYVVFLILIWLLPDWDKALAIGAASIIAMAYTYLGLRFGVFTKRQR
jgi:putative flippase GtrA